MIRALRCRHWVSTPSRKAAHFAWNHRVGTRVPICSLSADIRRRPRRRLIVLGLGRRLLQRRVDAGEGALHLLQVLIGVGVGI